jgi:peptide/nickel transport system permease protein
MSTGVASVSGFEERTDDKSSRAQVLWGVIKRTPLGATSACLILLIVVTPMFANLLAPYDPLAARPEICLGPPSWEHPFGADDIGRDVLSRVIYESRISLWVGLLAVGIGTVAGTIIGDTLHEAWDPKLRGRS